jgi:hypothetical protein
MKSLQQMINDDIGEMSVNRPENINRRSGRTIRLVDKYIQELFTEPIGTTIQIHDHYYNTESWSNHIMASKDLLRILLRRLQIEHRIEAGKPFYMGRRGYIMKVSIKNDIEIIILPYEGNKESSKT